MEFELWVAHTRAELIKALDGFDAARYLNEAGLSGVEVDAILDQMLAPPPTAGDVN